MCTSIDRVFSENSAPPLRQRVTIIVVTYNARLHIEACLRSLFASSREDLEVLVVDNASTDGTPDLVRREFPQVRVLSPRSNLGYGMAGNYGACASQSDYVALINQDIIFTPGWMEGLVAALDEDPRAALATPKILLKGDPSRINTCANVAHYTGITSCRGYNRSARDFAIREQVGAVSGAAFVARRAVFDSLGGFDPSFFLYLEDTDLSLRVALAGYRCLYVPEAVVMHEFEPRFSAQKVFFLERNRHAMLLKTYRWRTLLALLPALLLTELTVWGYSLLQGPPCLWSKLRAYAWVGEHLRQILCARHQAQIMRRARDHALLALCTADLQLDELGQPLGRLVAAAINPPYRAWYRLAQAVIRW